MAHLLFDERKGTLTLRGDHMNYSRAVKTGTWHQSREAEPKDYDISEHDVRDLCKATYSRIGPDKNPVDFTTTYQDLAEQHALAPDYTERPFRQKLVNKDTINSAILDRDIGDCPERGSGAVLPRFNPEFDKLHSETTYNADFKSTVPEDQMKRVEKEENPDFATVYRKCISQFSDTCNHRRPGRNTWQDESGVYATTHIKRQYHKNSNPISGEGCS